MQHAIKLKGIYMREESLCGHPQYFLTFGVSYRSGSCNNVIAWNFIDCNTLRGILM